MLQEEVMCNAWKHFGYVPRWAFAKVRPMPAHLHDVSFANALGIVVLLDVLLQFRSVSALELYGWSAVLVLENWWGPSCKTKAKRTAAIRHASELMIITNFQSNWTPTARIR